MPPRRLRSLGEESVGRFASVDCWRAVNGVWICCVKRRTTLANSPALLWRAQAYVDLGAAMRVDGEVISAREVLREGMELAHRCGATPLADRAEKELRAAGGRPRRRAGVGADALTASERRVAELAAGGSSNKEIAQSLFVTLRTVELHLSNAYGKLRIRSRHELAAALQT